MERADTSGQSSWDLGNQRSFGSGSFAPCRRTQSVCSLCSSSKDVVGWVFGVS